MKNYILYALIIILSGEILYITKEKIVVNKIQTPVSTPIGTISPTISPSPLPTSSPTTKPSPKPTLKPTPTPIPQPTFTSEQVYEFTNKYAGQYGVDPNVIRAIAICESGFKPDAKYIKYVGLFQFDSSTWKSLRTQMGEDVNPDLRANAEEAVQTAAYAISIGKRSLWPNCNP